MLARLSVPGGGDDAQAVLHLTFLPERAQRLQLLPPDPLVTGQGGPAAQRMSPGAGQAQHGISLFPADIKLTLAHSRHHDCSP